MVGSSNQQVPHSRLYDNFITTTATFTISPGPFSCGGADSAECQENSATQEPPQLENRRPLSTAQQGTNERPKEWQQFHGGRTNEPFTFPPSPPPQSSLLLLIELTAHPFPLPPSFTRSSKRALWTEVHFSFTSKLFVGGERAHPLRTAIKFPRRMMLPVECAMPMPNGPRTIKQRRKGRGGKEGLL